MQIEYISVNNLVPYENNARLHEDVEIIKSSIERFGFNDPIGIWHDNIVIEGHGRLQACKELGIKEVPCIRLDHLSDEERRAYGLAHNKSTDLSTWDFEKLDLELATLDMDMSEFKFSRHNEFFDNKEFDNSRQEGNDEYNDFIEKFKPKKTTDDCYTPDNVYDAVCTWVESEYNVKRKNFVRPFYPGGDYKSESYKVDDIVVDNPPFSILSEIINYYEEKNIRYFLFAPTLTLFSSSSSSSCAICVNYALLYENGAEVNTSFLTNLENLRFRSAPELYKALKEADSENCKEQKKQLPKYEYPLEVMTSTKLGQFSKYGINFEATKEETKHIRNLDSQKEYDKTIFGSGYLMSRNKTAEREQAEREQAERWTLSDREQKIIDSLE